MDDTIENLIPAWLTWLNAKYDLNVSLDDVRSWKLSEVYPTLTSKQIMEPLSKQTFWKTVTPKEDAVIYLKKLIEDGHKVYICTAAWPDSVKYKTEECLFKYFKYLDPKQLIIAHNKQMIKCDIIIDDGIHNLIDHEGIKILFTAPYNSLVDEKQYGFYRVYDWEETYKLVTKLAK